MVKKNILSFAEMKRTGEKVVWVTAYDFPTANLAQQAGIDMILVGDSLGMVVYGYSGTLPVTMNQMVYHSEAVRRGAPDVFVVGDLPFLSYQKSVTSAIENAGRLYQEAGVDAVKLEGGKKVAHQIQGIVDSGMVVIGHIGLTPQTSARLGGFRVQGNTAEQATALLEDARTVQAAGASILLIEGVPAQTGKLITNALEIPVYSIGAGPHCDGQLLIVSDMLGIYEVFTPKFVKKYANLAETIREAFQEYAREVRNKQFPTNEHCYQMQNGESQKLELFIKEHSRKRRTAKPS
jgi:3-methyl-2-oxobutanoate hydroxymethyltransferase